MKQNKKITRLFCLVSFSPLNVMELLLGWGEDRQMNNGCRGESRGASRGNSNVLTQTQTHEHRPTHTDIHRRYIFILHIKDCMSLEFQSSLSELATRFCNFRKTPLWFWYLDQWLDWSLKDNLFSILTISIYEYYLNDTKRNGTNKASFFETSCFNFFMWYI